MPNIERLKNEYDIKLKWRAHLLRLDVPIEGEEFSSTELKEKNDPEFESIAKEQNIPWTNNRAKRFRTQSAHIIAKWADENNIGDVYRQTVYYYYFVLQKNIAIPEVLKEIIIKTGFYEIKPTDILENKQYVEILEEDLKIANEHQIDSLPTIIFNEKMLNGFAKYEKLEKFVLE